MVQPRRFSVLVPYSQHEIAIFGGVHGRRQGDYAFFDTTGTGKFRKAIIKNDSFTFVAYGN